MKENIKPKIVFLVLLLASCLPYVSAPMALVGGIAFGLTAGNPWGKSVSVWTRRLLQISVVGLGFGMNLTEVIMTGKDAFLYTAISISLTMAVGLLLGKVFQTGKQLLSLSLLELLSVAAVLSQPWLQL